MGEAEYPAVWLVGGVERDKQAAPRIAREFLEADGALNPWRFPKAMHDRGGCLFCHHRKT